jgi:single-strand DNA-binding protein
VASFQTYIAMGNITRDPATKKVGENSVTEFGIAMNRRFKTAGGEDREEVTFVDVAMWGKRGEVVEQYFKKGDPIFIQGRLKLDTWDDKAGGGKRSKLSVVADEFQFVGGKKSDGGSQQDDAPAEKSTPKGKASPKAKGGAKKDDDVPF